MTESIHTAKYRKLRELLVYARKAQGLSQVALALEIDPHKVMRQLQAADGK